MIKQIHNYIAPRSFRIELLTFIRILIILECITISVFTVSAEIIEALLLLCFLMAPELRRRFFLNLTQPLVIMALVFYGVITMGLIYTIAPIAEGVDIWGSWRKLLLIPMVVSVYDDPLWKKRLIISFVSFMAFCAVISFLSHFLSFTIYKYPMGIVLHNHATQGMLFSVSFFICLVLLRYPDYAQGSRLSPLLLKLSMVILILNVLFVTPGRSGYLSLYIFITVFIYYNMSNRWRYFLLCIATLALSGILLLSPVAKNRIQMGITEIKNYEQSPYLTSMGIRMIMWKQTTELLQDFEHPLLGYGTGAFQKAYQKQVAGVEGWQGEPVDDPHNEYLRIAVEHGALGLLVFFAFIAAFFFQKATGPPRILAIGVLLAWCTTSFFNPHFSTFTEGRFLMLWCGALLALKDFGLHTPEETINTMEVQMEEEGDKKAENLLSSYSA